MCHSEETTRLKKEQFMMFLLLIVFLTLTVLLVCSFFLAIMLHARFHIREETQSETAQAELQAGLGNMTRPFPHTVTTTL